MHLLPESPEGSRIVMDDHRYPKRARLLRARDFERVFAARSSASDAHIVLHGAVNELGYPRLGLTVSRRIGAATVRNRWKRQLREAFRLAQHELPSFDLVCMPRGNHPPDLQQLIRSFQELAPRIEQRIAANRRRSSYEVRE